MEIKSKKNNRVVKESKVSLNDKEYSYITVSDIGNSRAQNQDSFVSVAFEVNSKPYLVSFVCDGMGGHTDGLYASLTVKNTLIDTLQTSKIKDEDSLVRVIESSLRKANTKIFEDYDGQSGTTAVGILTDGNIVYWWNIGDSRFYWGTPNDVVKVSKDHSLLQQALDNGEIQPENIKDFKLTNILTRAMGSTNNIQIDSGIIGLDDKNLVLCSDGFWHHLTEEELNFIHSKEVTTEYIENTINKIMQRGEKDNITVIVIKEETEK